MGSCLRSPNKDSMHVGEEPKSQRAGCEAGSRIVAVVELRGLEPLPPLHSKRTRGFRGVQIGSELMVSCGALKCLQ